MSGSPTTSGPTGISPALKYVLLAIVVTVGGFLGYLQGQPAITESVVIAGIVYVLPTLVSELENA